MAHMRARAAKKEKMQQFAQAHHHLYRPEPNWPEQQQVTGLNFGGNRSSASIITSESGDTVYVSEQSGQATKNPLAVVRLSGAETIATDSYCTRGLHSEMQTIYQLLMEWKRSGAEYAQFNIHTAEDFLKHRIGGGKAVAKGKGCCQLCAAILLKLGVSVGYIEPSHYENIWVDPFEEADVPNPWFT